MLRKEEGFKVNEKMFRRTERGEPVGASRTPPPQAVIRLAGHASLITVETYVLSRQTLRLCRRLQEIRIIIYPVLVLLVFLSIASWV